MNYRGNCQHWRSKTSPQQLKI